MNRPARYAKGVAKREEILRTALDVIARTGYRRTSVRELATAVGLSQAGLLHYFASKEELFAAVLRKRDEVDRAATLDRGGTAVAGLVEVVRHNADVPGLVQLHAQFSVEAGHPAHPAHADVVERYRRLRELLAGEIRERQAACEVPAQLDPAGTAVLLLAAADGLQTQWLLDPTLDMADHLGHLVDLLGLAPVTRPEEPPRGPAPAAPPEPA